jgi:TPR repeat protein
MIHGRAMKDLDALLQAFDQQNYARAAQLALPLAESGDVTAQETMGNIYQLGLCGEWDYAKAREWYEKAIAAGSGLAANNLAMIYSMGDRFVAVDRVKAKEFRIKARELGFEHAPID